MSLDAEGLPRYRDLPDGRLGGKLGWHVFGPDDDVGTVNLLTPERRRRAAGLVRTGETFSLDAPLGFFDPPLNPARGVPRHHVIDQPGGIGLDDVWDNLYPQAGSQWDSLAHIGYGRDVYYNGRTADEIKADRRNGVDRWAEHGIVGRGVLLDVPRFMQHHDRPYDPSATERIDVDLLEKVVEHAGLELETGDVLVLRTGFVGWYAGLGFAERRALQRGLTAPGLEQGEAVCEFLWDHHVAAVVTDTFAVEAWPADTSAEAAPFGFIHQMLIGSFGMALGELWQLDRLAEACAADEVHEFLFSSTPLAAPGGISSPANAIAVK